jgi:hypothetical protein
LHNSVTVLTASECMCKSGESGEFCVMYISFWFLVVLGFELRASYLLGWFSTASATPSAPFAQVILELVSHFLPRLAWAVILLL